MSRPTVLGKHRDLKWTGYCLKHYRDPASLYSLLVSRTQKHNLQSTNRAVDGCTEKRRRGRQLGDKILDDVQAVSDINNFIVEVWREVKVLDDITLPAVASKFHLRGERISAKAIKRRLERAHITESWSEYRFSLLRRRGEL